MSASADERGRFVRYTIAGLVASLIGVGVARLAYTPLIPHTVAEHWFSAGDVVSLGSANLIGYLFGAIFARRLGLRVGNVHAILTGELLIVVSLVALLPCLPKEERSKATGAIFLGLGLGIVIAAVFVPLLLTVSLRTTWLGLALLCAVLMLLTWTWWPNKRATSFPPLQPLTQAEEREQAIGQRASTILVTFGLMAVGVVPLMVFLSGFAVRELHVSAAIAALLFIVYGAGATCGPPLYAILADNILAQMRSASCSRSKRSRRCSLGSRRICRS